MEFINESFRKQDEKFDRNEESLDRKEKINGGKDGRKLQETK